MKLKMFAIFDTKAGCYSTPFFMQNKGLAIRAMQDMAMDNRTVINKHPADFVLFLLGEFDDNTGVIEKLTIENLGNPLVKKNEENQEELELKLSEVGTTVNGEISIENAKR